MVTAVMGARGGVGATTLAVALARAWGAGSVLVDADGPAGGLDAWLGVEDRPGVRWSGVQVAGGDLPADRLRAALPADRGVAVLAADRADLPDPAALGQVLAALAAASVPGVVDLPRTLGPVLDAALAHVDLLLLVVPGSVPGTLAAATVARAVTGRAAGLRLGAVVVGRELAPASVEAATGLPVLAAARGTDRLARVAAGVVDGWRR